MTEDCACEPWTPYAQYKWSVEQELSNIADLNYVVVRPAIVYGPGDRTGLSMYTHTLGCHPFNGFFSRTTWVSRYQKGKTSLDLNEARDYRVWDGSGISWTICKQPAPRFRQITTPTPHHSMFAGRMLSLTPNQQC